MYLFLGPEGEEAWKEAEFRVLVSFFTEAEDVVICIYALHNSYFPRETNTEDSNRKLNVIQVKE